MNRILNRILLLLFLLSLAGLLNIPRKRDFPIVDRTIKVEEADLSLPVERGSEIIDLHRLYQYFPDEYSVPEVSIEEPKPEIPESKPVEPEFTTELKFISSVVKEGRKSWFFKDVSSNRIYELSPDMESPPWTWISEENDFYSVKKKDRILKVRK